MFRNALCYRLWKKSDRRWFFYETFREEEDRSVREYLRDDSLRCRISRNLEKNQFNSLDNLFITEISDFLKLAKSTEDIDLAKRILYLAFEDPHYSNVSRLKEEIVNRFFVLCLNRNLPDEAVEIWRNPLISNVHKGNNLILRYRQLLFNSGHFRDLIEDTFKKEDLFDKPHPSKWREYWFYMASLNEIGDAESFGKASEWYWNIWDEFCKMELSLKMNFQVVSWLYCLLALKNKEYTSAYHAAFKKKDSISYQVVLQIFLETERLDDAVLFLKSEVNNIKVVGTDFVKCLTSKVRDSDDDDLYKELIKTCGILDAKVRLHDGSLSDQVYEIINSTEKRN